MKLLTPLGLIGLVGLIVWLIIYLLKPNYQNKYISSTYIWKLSLKYRKKNIPISKLRHILLLACQVLLISAAAFILAQPVISNIRENKGPDKIIVLDGSASMLSEYENVTRFGRAKDEILELASEAIDKNGTVTLISAGTAAETVLSDCADKSVVATALNELYCSYGTADVDGAMDLAFDALEGKRDAEVCFFTDTTYGKSGKVTVYNMMREGEWNAAILDVRTSFADGIYSFEVDIACYGKAHDVVLKGEVGKYNGLDAAMNMPVVSMFVEEDTVMTVVYTNSSRKYDENTKIVLLNENQKVVSYDHIRFYIEEEDSIDTDNEFYVYGGTLPKIRVQYYSSEPNKFFRNVLTTIGSSWEKNRLMDVELKVVPVGNEPELTGYDLYIFEHKMPDKLPTDGVVLMLDPDKTADAGFALKRRVTIKLTDEDGESLSVKDYTHPIMQYVEPSAIKVSEYVQVDENTLFDYDVLLNYQGYPVFFVKNTADTKIAVMTFSINKANMGISMFYPVLMSNFMSYFFPQTFSEHDYSVYDEVKLNGRGSSMTVVSASGEQQTYDSFPVTINANVPGTYTVTQSLFGDKKLIENFYVRVNSAESNISSFEYELENPEYTPVTSEVYEDLLLYLAIAIFVLSVAEWLLHVREGI